MKNFCTVDPKDKPSRERSVPSVNFRDADVMMGNGHGAMKSTYYLRTRGSAFHFWIYSDKW